MGRNKLPILCISVGAALILSALLLLLYNGYEDRRAEENASEVLPELRSDIEVRQEETESSSEEASDEMTIKMIDGCGYIGYLSMPTLELELPVLSEWDDERAKVAPCRQIGSTKTDDLILAGHNYRACFGRLSELSEGDAVTFTDMDGEVSRYQVAVVRVIPDTAMEEVQNGGYDLALYTCTYSGQKRVMVGCVRETDANDSECSSS